MPIEATLTCIHAGQLAEHLKQCPSLASAISAAEDRDGRICIDILHLLVAEDLYGHKHVAPSADLAVWESAAWVPVLSEKDLGPLEHTGYVGEWNTKFLSWLKLASEATGESVEIDYFHERGDYPYEYAWWSSSPSSPEDEVEVFGIQSHDGMNDPEWKREVVRHADGRVVLRAD